MTPGRSHREARWRSSLPEGSPAGDPGEVAQRGQVAAYLRVARRVTPVRSHREARYCRSLPEGDPAGDPGEVVQIGQVAAYPRVARLVRSHREAT